MMSESNKYILDQSLRKYQYLPTLLIDQASDREHPKDHLDFVPYVSLS